MPNSKPSYDDIVRNNVPLPDSSFRPTEAEAVEAEVPREAEIAIAGGSNAFPNEANLRSALAGLGVDVADLQIDVDGGTATMSGSVARSIDRERITTALGKVQGVSEIVDRLRIRLE